MQLVLLLATWRQEIERSDVTTTELLATTVVSFFRTNCSSGLDRLSESQKAVFIYEYQR